MRAYLFLTTVLFSASAMYAQNADTVLVNGKIATGDTAFNVREAVAIRDGKIAATGTSAQMRKLAGANTKVIDLQGRTVIPGLIDSHMHAIRAALFFATEVNWIGAPSLKVALDRMSEASRSMKPGAWLVVAGGWTVEQFAERRLPTQAELTEAAPNNPVYVQLGYGWAIMTPKALEVLHISGDADLPPGDKFERDASDKITGAVTGPQPGIVALFDRLPLPNYEQQLDGTRKFFRELNRLGMTGVVDPGGNNVTPDSYRAIFEVWRKHELTLRVAYALCGFTPGKEFEEYQNATKFLAMGYGDDMLRFNGIGERITWAMNNNAKPSEADKAKYYEILLWAAQRGMSVTMHSDSDVTGNMLLDIYERVNREVPITNLRWSLAHMNNVQPATLRRMKALGMGWTMQDEMYFNGDRLLKREGSDAARRTPPIETAREIGVPTGAGTDAHRVASYNPFTALQWILDGKTVTGQATRGREETPSRANALRLYTQGSAWFAHDEDKRGSLEAGKWADLAVLSRDYLSVPEDQIGGTESLLTMVGGKIVYAAGPFAKWEQK